MLLELAGWMLILLFAAGSLSLVAADPRRAKFAPLVYPVTFAVLWMLGFLLIILSLLGTVGYEDLALPCVFGTPLVGACAAALGYRAGVRRRDRAEAQLIAEELEADRYDLASGSSSVNRQP